MQLFKKSEPLKFLPRAIGPVQNSIATLLGTCTSAMAVSTATARAATSGYASCGISNKNNHKSLANAGLPFYLRDKVPVNQ